MIVHGNDSISLKVCYFIVFLILSVKFYYRTPPPASSSTGRFFILSLLYSIVFLEETTELLFFKVCMLTVGIKHSVCFLWFVC